MCSVPLAAPGVPSWPSWHARAVACARSAVGPRTHGPQGSRPSRPISCDLTRFGRPAGMPRSSTMPPTCRIRSGTGPAVMTDNVIAAAPLPMRFSWSPTISTCTARHGPLTEDTPRRATGPKGQFRARLEEPFLDAHTRGRVGVAIGRGSDFYGLHANSAAICWRSNPPAGEDRLLARLGRCAPHAQLSAGLCAGSGDSRAECPRLG